MSAPGNNYSFSNVSTDPTAPTVALDTRVGGNMQGRPFATVAVSNTNSSGNIYVFSCPFHGEASKLDVNSAPPSSAFWGVVPPNTTIPFRCGNNNTAVVVICADNASMSAIVQPEANT